MAFVYHASVVLYLKEISVLHKMLIIWILFVLNFKIEMEIMYVYNVHQELSLTTEEFVWWVIHSVIHLMIKMEDVWHVFVALHYKLDQVHVLKIILYLKIIHSVQSLEITIIVLDVLKDFSLIQEDNALKWTLFVELLMKIMVNALVVSEDFL